MTPELFLIQALPFLASAGQVATDFLIQALTDEVVQQAGEAEAARIGKLHAALRKYADERRELPPNHDLQRALYLSFLYATECIYQTRLEQLGERIEKHWLPGLTSAFASRLSTSVQGLGLHESEKPTLKRLLSELRKEQASCSDLTSEELATRMPFVPGARHLEALAAETAKTAPISGKILDDMLASSPWYRDAQEPVKALAREGLWELIGAFFADQIKTNQRVFRIMTVDLLGDMGLGLDQVLVSLAGVVRSVEEVVREASAIRRLLEDEYRRQYLLVDREFLEEQATKTPERMLDIAIGDWPLVAGKKCIQRDGALVIVERALEASEQIVFQIIPGEPGSGKTTILRQIGAALAERGCCVVEARADADLSGFQLHARRMAEKASSRLFLLVDNIYRDDRAALREFLADPGEALPVTIVATTPHYEDQTDQIRRNTHVRVLAPVSPDRLTDAELFDLRQIQGFQSLGQRRFKKLTESRKMLPVMLALSGGERFDTVVANTANRLRTTNRRMYEAWGVVTTFGRWNLPVPNSLFEKIIGYENLGYEMRHAPDGAGSDGLIFLSAYPFREGWFPGHQLIAQAAFDRVYKGRLKEFSRRAINGGDPEDPDHCVFVSRMLNYLCRSGPGGDVALARELFNEGENAFVKLADAAPESGTDWASAFFELGRLDLAKRYAMLAKPQTAQRALSLVQLLDKIGCFAEAQLAAEAWFEAHPDDAHVRVAYLALLNTRVSDAKTLSAVLKSTSEWLDKHPNEINLRAAYLALVRARVTGAEALSAALKKTSEWLDKHPEDAHVRAAYPGLAQKGVTGAEDLSAVLKNTSEWLDNHPEDTYVRAAYLRLVRARVTNVEALSAVLQSAGEWLDKHLEDTYVRAAYRGLAKTGVEGAKALSAVLKSTGEWLDTHPEDANLRAAYLDLAQTGVTAAEALLAVLKNTGEWLDTHPEDTYVRAAYLGLAQVRVTDATVLSAVLKSTGEWLDTHPEDTYVRAAYLGLAQARVTDATVLSAVLKSTGQWLDTHPEDTYVRAAYLGLARARVTDATVLSAMLKSTGQWLDRHADDRTVRVAYLGLEQARVADSQSLSTVLKSTSEWLDKHPEDSQVRVAYLGIAQTGVASPEALSATLKSTGEWLDTHPEDTNVRVAYLHRVRTGVAGPEALSATLKSTGEWLDTHPEDTNVRAAYLGLVRAKGSKGEKEGVLAATKKWLGTGRADPAGRICGNYVRLAQECQPDEDVEAAISDAHSWLKENSGASEGLIALADVLTARNELSQAAEVAQEAFNASPHSPERHQSIPGSLSEESVQGSPPGNGRGGPTRLTDQH